MIKYISILFAVALLSSCSFLNNRKPSGELNAKQCNYKKVLFNFELIPDLFEPITKTKVEFIDISNVIKSTVSSETNGSGIANINVDKMNNIFSNNNSHIHLRFYPKKIISKYFNYVFDARDRHSMENPGSDISNIIEYRIDKNVKHILLDAINSSSCNDVVKISDIFEKFSLENKYAYVEENNFFNKNFKNQMAIDETINYLNSQKLELKKRNANFTKIESTETVGNSFASINWLTRENKIVLETGIKQSRDIFITMHEIGHILSVDFLDINAKVGKHRADKCYNPNLALNEGFATYFAFLVIKNRFNSNIRFSQEYDKYVFATKNDPNALTLQINGGPAFCANESNESFVAKILYDFTTILEIPFETIWASFQKANFKKKMKTYLNKKFGNGLIMNYVNSRDFVHYNSLSTVINSIKKSVSKSKRKKINKYLSDNGLFFGDDAKEKRAHYEYNQLRDSFWFYNLYNMLRFCYAQSKENGVNDFKFSKNLTSDQIYEIYRSKKFDIVSKEVLRIFNLNKFEEARFDEKYSKEKFLVVLLKEVNKNFESEHLNYCSQVNYRYDWY